MPLEILLALAGFSLVTSVTPGPNNLMLLASGVNYGFRPTIPHMVGICAGFAFLLACVGLGLAQLLTSAPGLYTAIKYMGGAYLLYLAYGIAVSGPIKSGEAKGKPMTFVQAAAFQWVNPKAWVMAITAMTAYTSVENYKASVAIVTLVFAAINLPCVSIWCGFGTAMRGFLSDPVRLRTFNIFMALLLIISLWPMLR